MRNFHHRSQSGDTIVEVLIAIAVVSSVLGITYGIMNKNLEIMRDNQERTEATKLAQAQIESLKSWVDVRQNEVIGQGSNPFCINVDSDSIQPLTGTPPTNFEDEDYSVYVNCTSTLYSYFVQRDITAPDQDTYLINIRWPAFNGGDSQVIMSYRIP